MFNAGDIIDGHTICLKALVGSHNYNLDTPESDKDYKYFVWPTFDDLYDNEMYHKEVVTDTEDYTIHDIRKLPMLLWKANLNFIEILYSRELTGDSNLLKYLKENRKKLATMNLPRLYMAAMNMSLDKEKQMTKDSPARHEAIQKYGFDPKSACHAYRVLDFMRKYCETRSMRQAFWYADAPDNLLMFIKQGKVPLQTIKELLNNSRETITMFAQEILLEAPQNKGAYEAFQHWLKEAVRIKLD